MTSPQLLPQNVLDSLSKAAAKCSIAQRTFMEQTALRLREPNAGSTPVDELVELGEDRQDAVAFFKLLDEIGCGKFYAGRRGRESRIEWKPFGAIQIAKAFISEPNAYTPTSTASASHAVEAVTDTAIESFDDGFYDHTFLLRPGMKTRLRLPLDLTKEEASRLADFIRSLPF